MTFRERLADWITGGALTRALDVERVALCRYEVAVDWRADCADKYMRAVDSMISLRAALDRIAAMETTTANATVRRMAKVAREALK